MLCNKFDIDFIAFMTQYTLDIERPWTKSQKQYSKKEINSFYTVVPLIIIKQRVELQSRVNYWLIRRINNLALFFMASYSIVFEDIKLLKSVEALLHLLYFFYCKLHLCTWTIDVQTYWLFLTAKTHPI